MNTLTQAIAIRADARAKLNAAVAALSRARETAAECQREADRLAAEEARWVERLGKKISAWIAEGSRGSRPTAISDAAATQRQQSARANAAAAAEALSHFEASERAAREQLETADAAVAAAVEAQLTAEAEAIAEKVEEHLAEAARLGADLRRYQPDELNVPIGQLTLSRPLASVRVRRVLDKLERMEADGSALALNTRLCDLPWSGTGTLAGGSDFLAQRRAALISGAAAEPPEEHAA